MKCGICRCLEGYGARFGCENCKAYNLLKVDEAINALELEWGDEEVRTKRFERKKKALSAKRVLKDWMKGL